MRTIKLNHGWRLWIALGFASAALSTGCSMAALSDAFSFRSKGVNPRWVDTTVSPCDDFYGYACGEALEHTWLMPWESHVAPDSLGGRTAFAVHAVIEAAIEAPGADPAAQKLAAWYNACMDERAIDTLGAKPLEPLLAVIDAVKDRGSLDAAVRALHKAAFAPFFAVASFSDFADTTRVILGLWEPGGGLPDRDYYLEASPRSMKLRSAYEAHVVRMFTLLGMKATEAARSARDVVRIETALATLSQDKVTRRDPHAVSHKVSRGELASLAPHFAWDAYFDDLGLSRIETLTVSSTTYFAGMDELMQREAPEALRAYLTWSVLRPMADTLSSRFVAESDSFDVLFRGGSGPSRARRCMRSTDETFPDIVGRLYVASAFDAERKRAVEALLHTIRDAMERELEGLSWMDAETRREAKTKLASMGEKVGYPNAWKTYDFDVGAGYAANVLVESAFEQRHDLAKVGKLVDRGEWPASPQTVNAFYSPWQNEMVFPAAILRPPLFFDPTLPLAVNFGAMGPSMGHELTHAFDDQGRQFDATGRLRDWWTAASSKAFTDRAQCIVDQYAAYEPLPGLHINGALTEGENIADLGGLKLAWSAYKKARAAAGGARGSFRGFTEDQSFFVSYAQASCEKMQPELLETRTRTDTHSPKDFRVNGSLSNLPAFGEAFSCKVGSPMRPAKTCDVW